MKQELTTTPYNRELVGSVRGTESVVFARGHMALNAEINQIVLYLGPAPQDPPDPPNYPQSQYDGHPYTPWAGKTGLG